MGNVSNFDYQQGCKINLAKLEEKLKDPNSFYYMHEAMETFLTESKLEPSKEIGDILDGHKIQGYWYPEFCKFLYELLDIMENDSDEQYIEMTEEQGFRFVIHFCPGDKVWMEGAIMVVESSDIKRDGTLVDMRGPVQDFIYCHNELPEDLKKQLLDWDMLRKL
jgi:hypothetical protein